MISIELGFDPDWVPDACTLPTVEQPLRLAEFDAVFTALTAVERTGATHAMLTLTGEPGLAARARDLGERETACCSFFTFNVTATGASADASSDAQERVRMSITVPEAHAAVLEALLDRAEEGSR